MEMATTGKLIVTIEVTEDGPALFIECKGMTAHPVRMGVAYGMVAGVGYALLEASLPLLGPVSEKTVQAGFVHGFGEAMEAVLKDEELRLIAVAQDVKKPRRDLGGE
jgi:hypothetical protein